MGRTYLDEHQLSSGIERKIFLYPRLRSGRKSDLEGWQPTGGLPMRLMISSTGLQEIVAHRIAPFCDTAENGCAVRASMEFSEKTLKMGGRYFGTIVTMTLLYRDNGGDPLSVTFRMK
jgi:hypothetical protein